MARSGITGPSDGGGGAALSLTVAFEDLAAESDLEEFKNLLGDGSRSSDHNSHAATKNLLELVENQTIINGMSGLCLGS